MLFFVLILTLALLTSSLAQTHYLDCPGNDNTLLDITRRCCTDPELPNDCECFDISDDFGNALLFRPQCPADVKVTFRLYTQGTQYTAQTIKAGTTSVRSSAYSSSRPTVFIAHGFTDSGTATWILNLKNELLADGDKNVIGVDWQQGAKAPNYYQAAVNTRTVGAMIARLIVDMVNNNGASYSNFHLIGHSLGAHVMGSAGKEVNRLTGHKVGRISGLDPAGPCFEDYNEYVRLDSSDADFVDVIHTDAEPLLSSGFGIRRSVGHVDFRPNGGVHQPGCPAETYGILSMISFDSEAENGACSHSRVTALFTNSVNKCRWDSPTSGSTCTMGYHVSKGCRGDHSPTTISTEPYC